jgi:LytS/YehU family sensor histidine kinase
MLEAQTVLRNLRRVKTMVNSERAVTAILETKPEELSAVAVIIDHEKVNNHRRNVYTLKELSGGW